MQVIEIEKGRRCLVFGVEACWRDDDDEDEIYRYCVWC